MNASRILAAALTTATLGLTAASTASAYSEHSVGTPEQIAWVRRAAGNFLAAELADNGGGACAILTARQRRTIGHASCEQRQDARLHALLRAHGARAQLRALRRAASTARVVVGGDQATIELPSALLADSANRFRWTENCWMLEH
jgi:hypothetical protein